MNRYRLTDICDFQGGSQPPKSQWKDTYKNGYIRMLQIRDFTQKPEKIEYVKETNSIKKCSEDDILIARYGASIGKILTGLEGAYNVAIVKTIPNSKILSKTYLYYYLNSSIFQKYIKNVGSRAAQAGFNKKELNKLEIDLPTLDKQKIIVENLQKIQNIISKKEYQIAALDNLIKSLFVNMFNDKIQFPRELLKNNIEEMFIGPFGSDLKNEFFVDKTSSYCVVYEQKHAINKYIGDFRYINKDKYNKLKRFEIQPEDIIVSCRGTIGETYVIPKNSPLGIMHPSIMKIRLKKDKYNSIFFNEIISNYLYENAEKNNGGIIKMAIKASDLANTDFIRPDIKEQENYLK